MQKDIENKKKYFLLFSVLFLALLLRLYRFPTAPITSNDEMFFLQNTFRPIMGFLSFDPNFFITEMVRYLNYQWGPGALILGSFWVGVLTFLHIPLTEVLLAIPYLLFSLVGILLLYKVTLEIHENQFIALLAALLYAGTPLFVTISRVPLPHLSATVLFLATIFFFLRYFKTHQRKYFYYGFLSLGIQFSLDGQIYFVLPILFFCSLIFWQESSSLSFFQRILSSFRHFFHLRAILPFLLVLSPLFVSFFYYTSEGYIQNTYIFHPFTKEKSYGFFGVDVFAGFAENNGYGLMILFMLGILWSIWKLSAHARNTDAQGTFYNRKNILFVLLWFIIAALPWLFLISSEQTNTASYSGHMLHPLLIMSACLLYATSNFLFALSRNWLKMWLTLFSLLFLFFLFFTTSIALLVNVYGYNTDSFIGYTFTGKETIGAYRENTGIKTAGYYIRNIKENNDDKEIIVFSHDLLFAAEYYFTQPVLSDFESRSSFLKDKWIRLTKDIKPDYVVLEEKNYDVLKSQLQQENYYIVALVTQNGKVITYILSREQANDIVFLSVEETDPLFDEKYGDITSLFISYG